MRLILFTSLLVGLFACSTEKVRDHRSKSSSQTFSKLQLVQDDQDARVKECLLLIEDFVPFKCLQERGKAKNGKPLTVDDYEACNCHTKGNGNGTEVGERPVYYCVNNPPIYLSPNDSTGMVGVLVIGEQYEGCIFDYRFVPGTFWNDDGEVIATNAHGAPSSSGSENCFDCHKKTRPFKKGGNLPPPDEVINIFNNTTNGDRSGGSSGGDTGGAMTSPGL